MNSVKDIKNWRILNTDNYFIGRISYRSDISQREHLKIFGKLRTGHFYIKHFINRTFHWNPQ